MSSDRVTRLDPKTGAVVEYQRRETRMSVVSLSTIHHAGDFLDR